MSQQRSPWGDARGRRRPRVGPFRPLPTLGGLPPSGCRTGDLTGPLVLTRERPDEVPPGREIPTLLDDFHHVHRQLLQQRRGIADHLRQDQVISPRLAELARGAARSDRLESIRWQTVADVLTAGGSPTECAAALDLHAPATRSHELRAWADMQRAHALMSENDQRRIVLRRDPSPGSRPMTRPMTSTRRDHLHQPGGGRARPCLPGLARVDHDPGRAAAAPGAAPRAARTPHPPTTRRRARHRQARHRRGRGLTSTVNERISRSAHLHRS